MRRLSRRSPKGKGGLAAASYGPAGPMLPSPKPDSVPMQSWQQFYEMIGGAGATLLGLLFVSVSLNAEQILGPTHKHSFPAQWDPKLGIHVT